MALFILMRKLFPLFEAVSMEVFNWEFCIIEKEHKCEMNFR